MLILADRFLAKLQKLSPGKYPMNTLKIYEYIIYHDLFEVEVIINNMPRKGYGYKTPLEVMNKNNQFKPGFEQYPNTMKYDFLVGRIIISGLDNSHGALEGNSLQNE